MRSKRILFCKAWTVSLVLYYNLMNENYQVGSLDLPVLWILLQNCDQFMVEGVCKDQ